jgi:hypothetical protein
MVRDYVEAYEHLLATGDAFGLDGKNGRQPTGGTPAHVPVGD